MVYMILLEEKKQSTKTLETWILNWTINICNSFEVAQLISSGFFMNINLPEIQVGQKSK